jgi:hypothetical protein
MSREHSEEAGVVESVVQASPVVLSVPRWSFSSRCS